MESNRRYKKRYQKKEKRNYAELKIGVFLYSIIFIYLAINIIRFVSKNDINFVIAETGSIYNSDTFKGVIVRNETIVKSDKQGVVTNFKKQGEKVKIGDYVCSIDQDGEFTSILKQKLTFLESDIIGQAEVSSEKYNAIYKDLSTFSSQYDPSRFKEIYALKDNISYALDSISNEIFSSYSSELEVMLNNKELFQEQLEQYVHLFQAPESGVISYSIDGYEEMRIDTIDYQKLSNVKKGKPLSSEDEEEEKEEDDQAVLYKIVDNSRWHILLEINAACEAFIEDKKILKLYFPKQKISVESEIIELKKEDNNSYIVLEIDRYLHMFLEERIVDVEIDYNEYNGIKIPNASIIKKEFLAIPEEYVIKEGNSKSIMKKVYGEQYVGGESVEIIKIGLNYYENNVFYIPIIDQELIKNDTIVKPESLENYVVSNTSTLEGVYVVNKGYTNFKLIEPIHSTDKYTIVKRNTPYGIRTYDRIISDTLNIDENTIIY